MSARRTSIEEVFDNGKTMLQKILKEIEAGQLQLPNFQRTWRWPDSHITSLLESIAEGHPIGAVMFLETGGDALFEYRPLQGAEATAGDGKKPSNLIMDGQQRLTSLYQALFTREPVLVNADRRPQRRLYFCDMEAAVDGTRPIREAIVSIHVDHNGRPVRADDLRRVQGDYQFENLLFPLNMAFRSVEWFKRFDAYWGDRPDRHMPNSVCNEFRAFLRRFESCHIATIKLSSNISIEGICTVYEKLNSQAMPLDAFDLMIAHYAAKKFNLASDWYGEQGKTEGRKNRLKQESRGLLADLKPKQFMQCVAMIRGLKAGRSPLVTGRSELLSLPLEDYLDMREEATRGFLEAADFLTLQRITPREVPGMNVITALAAILGHLGQRAKHLDAQEKLKRWFFSIVYTSGYASGAEKAMSFDVPEVVRWLNGGEKEPLKVARARVVDEQVATSTNKTAIHSIMGPRIMERGAVDFGTGEDVQDITYLQKSYNMHHIFPMKWCKENKIPQIMADSAVNKTPMSAGTNQLMGGNSPKEYLELLQRARTIPPDRMDEIVRSHGINPEHLRTNNFAAFFAERQQFLHAIIEADMGKPVARTSDLDNDGVSDLLDHAWLEGADLRMISRGAVGYARIKDSNQLVIMADSILSASVNPSLHQTSVDFREKLQQDGLVELMEDGRWRLLDEFEMAPSTAASVLSGNVTGIRVWRKRNGEVWAGRVLPRQVSQEVMTDVAA